jgi:hypothetical protein
MKLRIFYFFTLCSVCLGQTYVIEQYEYQHQGSTVTGTSISYYNAGGELELVEEYHGEVRPSYRPVHPPAELLQVANVFKTVLQIHFGEGAETNRSVTAQAVTEYFLSRRIAGTAEPNDASDMIILREGFEAIKSYTMTGESWSFFEGIETDE